MHLRFINILAAAAIISACAGTNFDWDSARGIKTGMTEEQVSALMGPPYLVKSTPDGLTWVWSYANSFSGVRTVSVVFKDGLVVAAPEIPASFR